MMIEAKVGDILVRNLAGVRLPVIVTTVTDKLIICGNDKVPGGDETNHIGWWFDRETGAEIDEQLGWGPPPLSTGSYLDVGQEVLPMISTAKAFEDKLIHLVTGKPN